MYRKLTSIFILCISALVGCHHDTGAGPVPNASQIKASFNPSASPGNIRLALESAQGDIVSLDVIADSAPQFTGMAFKISYDNTIAQFIGCDPGQILETSATPLYAAAIINGIEGHIAVGASLKRGDTMVSGTGTILKLRFKVIARGNTALTFYENVLRDNTFSELSGLTWSTGTITGT